MKILYLSYATDQKTFDAVEQAGLEPSVARHRFETAMLEQLLSLREQEGFDVELVSCVPYNEQLKDRPAEGQLFGEKVRYIWWENKRMIAGIRQVWQAVKDWRKRTKGEPRVILTYATNPVIFLPRFLRGGKLVTICSEVPQFRAMLPSLSSKLKKAYYHYLNEHMDGYIYFSAHMQEVCNRKRRPAITVEGMPSVPADANPDAPQTERPEQIFYAGGLNRENGILQLLEGFAALERQDVTLTLCGTGNVEDQVVAYSRKYPNIQFLGTLPNNRILELEKQATLLMNPRRTGERLTRYSFPSKTFEYFCSGTPCMMSRLDGIPEEYYRYCYTCDSSSAQALREDLQRVLSIPQQQRYQLARQAFHFILEEKTAKQQTKKIVDFLKTMQ